MSKFTITPWRTQADLIQVRQQLYSLNEDGADSRRHAVNRAMAWKLRGNLPHAVESTALLVDAVLHHDITTNSIFSIRAVYSAAFSRFVTGFCDIGRHKERTLEPSSMLEIAKQIDMPLEFVALRHEATHEELPGIQRLVSAVKQALDWLWRVYWGRLEEPEEPESVAQALPAIKSDLSTLLRNFRKSRRDALRNKSPKSLEGSAEVANACDACVEICNGSRSRIEALATVLVEERLILPSTRELGSSLEGAYLIWDELLHNLSAQLHKFLSALVRSLMQALTKETFLDPQTDADKEAYAMWLLHVLDSDSSKSSSNEEVHSLQVEVLRWCCLHPGLWAARIGRELLSRGDESMQRDWRDLFEASLSRGGAVPVEAGVLEKDFEAEGQGAGYLERDKVAVREADSRVEGWVRAVAPVLVPIGKV